MKTVKHHILVTVTVDAAFRPADVKQCIKDAVETYRDDPLMAFGRGDAKVSSKPFLPVKNALIEHQASLALLKKPMRDPTNQISRHRAIFLRLKGALRGKL